MRPFLLLLQHFSHRIIFLRYILLLLEGAFDFFWLVLQGWLWDFPGLSFNAKDLFHEYILCSMVPNVLAMHLLYSNELF